MRGRFLPLFLAAVLLAASVDASVLAADENGADAAAEVMEITAEEEEAVVAPVEEGAAEGDQEEEIINVEDADDLLADPEGGEPKEDENTAEDAVYHVSYTGHVQTYGWRPEEMDGASMGTVGQGKRLEAMKIRIDKEVTDEEGNTTLEAVEDALAYQAHVQTYGWMDPVGDDQLAGTTGKAKRVEAFKVKLQGELAEIYDIYYCVHAQHYGWMGWAKNGAIAGTAGMAYRLEAMQIKLVKKGDPAPAPVGSMTQPYMSPTDKGMITYQAHAQSYGWMTTVADGALAGTSGQGKRLEAIKVWLNNPVDEDGNEIEGSVTAEAHVQSHGWMAETGENAVIGTVGQGKRMEAVRLNLTGDIAEVYDIYYRVHSQTFGWLGWAKNGQTAGSEGYGKRIEAIEIRMVAKDDTETAASLADGRPSVSPECIGLLSGHYARLGGDLSFAAEGTKIVVGEPDGAVMLDTLAFAIDTSSTNLFGGSIEYRVLTSQGWTDWAANGQPAYLVKEPTEEEPEEKEGDEAAAEGEGEETKEPDNSGMIQAVQIRLSGELGQLCDVYYRANVDTKGWMGWTSNGSAAGTSGYSLALHAVEVTVVTKGSAAPGSTSTAYMDKSNLANQVLSSIGRDLRKAFNWCAGMTYVSVAAPKSGSHIEYYGNMGLKNHRGNCYVMAAAFVKMARELGYKAYLCEGWVPAARGGLTVHGWVEIEKNGAIYVCDPDFQHETGRNGYMFPYRTSGTWKYQSYRRVE